MCEASSAWTYIFVAHIQEFVELNASVRKRAEATLLLHVGSDLGVGNVSLSQGD